MVSTLPQVTNTRANTCPHGLPLGACPICNGMGGGGSTKKLDEPRRPGEMTYMECYAQWKQMQRADAQKEAMQEAMLKNAQLAAKMQEALLNITTKISTVLDQIQNALPKPVAKVFSTISNNVLKPLLNMIKDLPQLVRALPNAIEALRNEITQVAQKLAALIGEAENFVQKKLSDATRVIKKQFRKLLSVLGLESDFEDDENKIDEEMSVFKQFEIEELKEAVRKLFDPKRKEDEIARRTNKSTEPQI